MIVAEREIDVLRRQAEANLPIGPAQLARIQYRLREEVLKVARTKAGDH